MNICLDDKYLEHVCEAINNLFNDIAKESTRAGKVNLIADFKNKNPQYVGELDFAFEVLNGRHKLGYTYNEYIAVPYSPMYNSNEKTLKGFVDLLKTLGSSEHDIAFATKITPLKCRDFIAMLVNRKFRLGYTNQQALITSYSPMLAKRYPETFREGYYLVQEKLDGNRCVATWDGTKWKFYYRSGKEMKVDFDMSWADKAYAYDGEVMTLGHAGTRDFNRTSGAINGKYTDKSALHYYVYDIIAENIKQSDRLDMLSDMSLDGGTYLSQNVSRLPTLEKVWVNANIEYNGWLDKWLDKIVDKGGEGIILRDPDGMYQHKRCNELLKYKKVQTMDLRIIDWNEGKGKYEGLIGSFVCETDDHKIQVNVSGISDDMRYKNPEWYIGKIIEVAYFDVSKSKDDNMISLRFPRFKKMRDDKNETSIY